MTKPRSTTSKANSNKKKKKTAASSSSSSSPLSPTVAETSTATADPAVLAARLHDARARRRHRHAPTVALVGLIGLFLASGTGVAFSVIAVLFSLRVTGDALSRVLVFAACAASLLYIIVHAWAARTRYVVTQHGPPWLYGNHLHAAALLLSRAGFGVWIAAIISTSLLVSGLGFRLDAKVEVQLVYLNLFVSGVGFLSMCAIIYCIEASRTPFKTAVISQTSFLQGRPAAAASDEDEAELSVSRRVSLEKASRRASAAIPPTKPPKFFLFSGKTRKAVAAAAAAEEEEQARDSPDEVQRDEEKFEFMPTSPTQAEAAVTTTPTATAVPLVSPAAPVFTPSIPPVPRVPDVPPVPQIPRESLLAVPPMVYSQSSRRNSSARNSVVPTAAAAAAAPKQPSIKRKPVPNGGGPTAAAAAAMRPRSSPAQDRRSIEELRRPPMQPMHRRQSSISSVRSARSVRSIPRAHMKSVFSVSSAHSDVGRLSDLPPALDYYYTARRRPSETPSYYHHHHHHQQQQQNYRMSRRPSDAAPRSSYGYGYPPERRPSDAPSYNSDRRPSDPSSYILEQLPAPSAADWRPSTAPSYAADWRPSVERRPSTSATASRRPSETPSFIVRPPSPSSPTLVSGPSHAVRLSEVIPAIRLITPATAPSVPSMSPPRLSIPVVASLGGGDRPSSAPHPLRMSPLTPVTEVSDTTSPRASIASPLVATAATPISPSSSSSLWEPEPSTLTTPTTTTLFDLVSRLRQRNSTLDGGFGGRPTSFDEALALPPIHDIVVHEPDTQGISRTARRIRKEALRALARSRPDRRNINNFSRPIQRSATVAGAGGASAYGSHRRSVSAAPRMTRLTGYDWDVAMSRRRSREMEDDDDDDDDDASSEGEDEDEDEEEDEEEEEGESGGDESSAERESDAASISEFPRPPSSGGLSPGAAMELEDRKSRLSKRVSRPISPMTLLLLRNQR